MVSSDWLTVAHESSQDCFYRQTWQYQLQNICSTKSSYSIVIIFVGKVYNVTPYMEYHPGGIEELMRGAGQDGTLLFDEVSQCDP